MLLNDGHGAFTPQTPVYDLGSAFPYPTQAFLTADFNGDGLPDLALGGGPASGRPPAEIAVLFDTPR